MIDDKGRQVKEAGPSMPVEVLGLSACPVGRRSVHGGRERGPRPRSRRLSPGRARPASAPPRPRSASRTCSPNHASTIKEFPLVIKADVQGSVEAIVDALNKTLDRRDQGPRAPFGRRRDHRERRDAGERQRRADHRLQRPPQRQGARGRRAQQGRVPLLRRHLPPDRLGEGRRWPASSGPRSSRRSSAAPRSRKSSRRARRTRRPACSSLEGVIRKGLNARLTREDVIVSKTTIASLRRFKDDVAEVRAGPRMRRDCWPTPTTSSRATILEVFEVEERARTL